MAALDYFDRNAIWKAEEDAKKVADEAEKRRKAENDAAAVLARTPTRQPTQENPPPPPPSPPVPPPPEIPCARDLNELWADADKAALAKRAPQPSGKVVARR